MKQFAVCFCAFLLSLGVSGQAPAPASPTAEPGVTTTTVSQVQDFQKIEDSWSTAINSRDQYALELVLSPLFVDISAGGDVTTRNQQLADLIQGQDKSLHLEQKVITVRLLGDTAVANGTYLLHHRSGSKEVDEKGIFTHVFERVRGNWLCINSQRTTVVAAASGKSKKQSTADEPFHIPFFSKSDKTQ